MEALHKMAEKSIYLKIGPRVLRHLLPRFTKKSSSGVWRLLTKNSESSNQRNFVFNKTFLGDCFLPSAVMYCKRPINYHFRSVVTYQLFVYGSAAKTKQAEKKFTYIRWKDSEPVVSNKNLLAWKTLFRRINDRLWLISKYSKCI